MLTLETQELATNAGTRVRIMPRTSAKTGAGRKARWLLTATLSLAIPLFGAPSLAIAEQFNSAAAQKLNSAAAQQLFDTGLQTFNAGQHQLALEHFLDAWQQGYRRPVVRYNIAVCHAQLGDYGKAKKAFSSLAGDPQFGDMANYSIAQIHLLQQDYGKAIALFSQLTLDAEDENLVELASIELLKLESAKTQVATAVASTQQSRSESSFIGLLDLSLQASDSLQVEELDSATGFATLSDSEGTGTQLLLSGQSFDYHGFSAGSSFYSLQYEAERNNVQSLAAWGRYNTSFGPFEYSVTALSNRLEVGGIPYLSLMEIRNHLSSTIGHSNRLEIELRQQRSSDDHIDYEHLAGNLTRLSLTYHVPGKLAWWTEMAWQREDKGVLEYEISYDPTDPTLYSGYDSDHTEVGFGIDYAIRSNIQLSSSMRWRISDYLDPYRVEVDPTSIEVRSLMRTDNRFTAAVQLEYRASSLWSLYSRLERTDANSTLDNYDYTGNEISFGFSRSLSW